jgi:hypothetical protein
VIVMPRPLLLVLLAALAVAALPDRSLASTSQVMTFEAPSELLDDSRREATLDEIQGFGVRRVRQLVYWRDFSARPRARTAPRFDTADPLAYPAGTWDVLDRTVDAVVRRGIELQLTLTGPVPRWATRGARDQRTEPGARAFGRWVRAVALRYGSRVHLWSVWNEPNHPDFLAPQYRGGAPASAAIYRRLYKAAERALHGVPGGASDRVLFGETAPIGNQNVVSPLAFLRGALCLDRDYDRRRGCGKLRIDGYAHHAYTRRVGPRFRSTDTDEVSIGSLDRLVGALDRAARAGAIDRGRGIYLTEFGIQSKPDPIAGVSYARQAEYLAIAERMAYANPRVKAFSQYLMRDDKPRRGGTAAERYSGFETGLRRANGTPKPSYDGFMLPLAVTRYGPNDVLWGRVRPATGLTEVVIEHTRRGRWRRLTATQTLGVYGLRSPHRKGQRYRVKWTRPDGRVVTGPPIRPY